MFYDLFVRGRQIYPSYVTEGLRESLEAFERRMPGFVCNEALLHGVETRTSSPVQVKVCLFSLCLLSIAGADCYATAGRGSAARVKEG